MRLLDTNPSWGENADGLYLKHTQDITDDFLKGLKEARLDSVQRACGEYERVASVPTFVVELWLRQGIDVWQMTPQQIVKKLRDDDLHCFLATDKRV